MRNINDDKGSFTTKGNTNGTYDYMQRTATDESKARFKQKPWYMVVAEQKNKKE